MKSHLYNTTKFFAIILYAVTTQFLYINIFDQYNKIYAIETAKFDYDNKLHAFRSGSVGDDGVEPPTSTMST